MTLRLGYSIQKLEAGYVTYGSLPTFELDVLVLCKTQLKSTVLLQDVVDEEDEVIAPVSGGLLDNHGDIRIHILHWRICRYKFDSFCDN